ncbi:YbaB/EbfC family nucleoid-associated protein [Sphaerisporangium sp. TRM90804]|uniref:YbaB/EbfC family nucleoid-associated protein n=1 Tax=Sphaerisporangium sp. TRM90804 TaxID=3031113 RepID=UPI0024476C14|nr:YbaB/EbfC family nucleoid-associated protein [Sphaerisporangium sp. TRM90804]MDH2425080.1 YbaB/EbfC family nucleoid-associated protein [Sphaerisporangium sp. TRM90804]
MFDPDDFRLEDFDRVAEQSREAVRRLGGVLGELREVTGEGEAAGGLVSAVVDSGGRVQTVTIDPRAMRLDSRAVSEAVTEAVRAAQLAAARAGEDLLRDAMGHDLPPLDGDAAHQWLEDVTRTMTDPGPGPGSAG